MENEFTEQQTSLSMGYGNQNELFNQLPEIVTGEIEKLNELSKSVQIATRMAEDSKKAAKLAYSKSAGWGKKKEAIEELQKAQLALAESNESNVKAQKVSFEFQQKLAETSKFLFGLGVLNIANNRSVVRQIELSLKGASQKKISELARQEFKNVIKQLKAQEDILVKIDGIKILLKSQGKDIEDLNSKIEIDNEIIKSLQEEILLHSRDINFLKNQSEVIDSLNSKIKEKEVVDERQDHILRDIARALANNVKQIKHVENVNNLSNEIQLNNYNRFSFKIKYLTIITIIFILISIYNLLTLLLR